MEFFKPTFFKRALFFLISDLILLSISFYFSYSLRFDFKISENFLSQMYYWLPFVILFKVIFLGFFNLYSASWRFVSITEFISIVKAFTVVLILMIIFDHFAMIYAPSIFIPRTVPFIDYFISIFLISSLRISKRVFTELKSSSNKTGKKSLIIGADETGEQVARTLIYSKEYQPVAFLDDDKNKRNVRIHGIKVYGEIDKLEEFLSKNRIDAVIVAIPDISYSKLKKIIDVCKHYKINDIKILPKLLSSKKIISLKDLKDITIENLLSREVVKIDEKSVEKYFQDKNILVTGAGGSIGSEIVRQLLKFKPQKIVGYELDETELYNLTLEVANDKFIPVVGDIRDSEKFKNILKNNDINIVFHAAAYKHVPLMEFFPEEAVKTNILGTYNIAKICIEQKIEKFINISTDKAVNPVNIMGQTKRIAEIICSTLNSFNVTKFISVRFGNVLGSRGSVIPIFLEQIKNGGPVKVTHPEIERFFMTIPEAVLLVLQATIMGDKGEIFILDMGEPVKIVELAENLIKLQGLTPYKDINIEFTGLRPGEKLKEELLNSEEEKISTSHEKIFKTKMNVKLSISELENFIYQINIHITNREKLKKILFSYQ